ncbi:autoinducer binding domain-containing protein [Roseibium algae]|uniref:Autoinducer binding domain-containing protein n=1 Tax=Roseibium algae TaxID=3123038 RepID=A0ABU8TL40_9HYPH
MDFTKTFSKINSIEDMASSLSNLATNYGFSAYALATFTGRGSLTHPHALASGGNPEWRTHYLDNQYVIDDPVVARAARGAMPFVWSDTKNDHGITKRGVAILEEARSFNLTDGVLIPVYGSIGFEGSLFLAGDRVDVTPEEMKALHLAGIYAYDHSMMLTDRSAFSKPNSPSLTNREIECLKWTAAGKTSADISDTLGISRHTADWYLKEATAKLKARNRTHAVAEALRLKLIN